MPKSVTITLVENWLIKDVSSIVISYIQPKLQSSFSYSCQGYCEFVTDEKTNMQGACFSDCRERVHRILSKDLSNLETGLWHACMGGHFDLVKLLLLKGANTYYKSMTFAKKNGHTEIFNYLNKLYDADKQQQSSDIVWDADTYNFKQGYFTSADGILWNKENKVIN
jgi:hypothetical protein